MEEYMKKKESDNSLPKLIKIIIVSVVIIISPLYRLITFIKNDVINFNLNSLRSKRIDEVNLEKNTLFGKHYRMLTSSILHFKNKNFRNDLSAFFSDKDRENIIAECKARNEKIRKAIFD